MGLGKTVQLGMAAEIVALTRPEPVLVLAPKSLLLQWQEELWRMLAVPTARWIDGRWVAEDGTIWPNSSTACPRRIGLFPTSLVTAGTAAAQALLAHRYACVVLDEAHRARRPRTRGQEDEPTKLMEFMFQLAPRAASLLLGTATPIQMHRMELYDLMTSLHRGCERVLGDFGSPWNVQRDEAMDIVAGLREPPSSIAQLWAWLRDPLIPKAEHAVATQVRAELNVPDAQTSACRTRSTVLAFRCDAGWRLPGRLY